MKNINRIISLSLLSSCILLGADVPNIGTIQKEIKPPKNIIKDEKGLIQVDGVKKVLPPMIDDKSGKTIFVKDFAFSGNTKFSDEALSKLVSEYKNKELSFNDLQKIATIITKTYRDNGYFVARAYIPIQDMKESIVTIAIIEGEFGSFNIKNSSRVKDSIVQSVFDEAKKYKVISTSVLERQMLIANDIPGLYVSKADVKAGKEVGTSDFDIETIASKTYDGYIIVDNYGSRYTGKTRLMAGLNLNSPFKIGDKLSLVGLTSSGSGLKYGDISYDTFLLPNGLRGGLGYSYTKYELAKEYANLDANGTSKVLNANLSYPIIRTRDENLYAKFDFDNKKLQDNIDSTNTETKKEINVATAGIDYTSSSVINYLPTATNFSFSLTHGNLTFKDDTSLSNDQSGANTSGNYSKLNIEAFKSIGFTKEFSVDGTLKYQHSFAHKNLDGSEDLSIGGTDGVKVYPTSEASAENGYIGTIEAKYLLPTFDSNYIHTAGIFYDRAAVYMADNSNVNNDKVDLQDIGISYYVTYNDFFVNSHVAWKLNSDTVSSEPSYNSKFLVQAGWVF